MPYCAVPCCENAVLCRGVLSECRTVPHLAMLTLKTAVSQCCLSVKEGSCNSISRTDVLKQATDKRHSRSGGGGGGSGGGGGGGGM